MREIRIKIREKKTKFQLYEIRNTLRRRFISSWKPINFDDATNVATRYIGFKLFPSDFQEVFFKLKFSMKKKSIFTDL